MWQRWKQFFIYFFSQFFAEIFKYFIQHRFICHPSDSSVSEDAAEIEVGSFLFKPGDFKMVGSGCAFTCITLIIYAPEFSCELPPPPPPVLPVPLWKRPLREWGEGGEEGDARDKYTVQYVAQLGNRGRWGANIYLKKGTEKETIRRKRG
jgi:hypothetical protein